MKKYTSQEIKEFVLKPLFDEEMMFSLFLTKNKLNFRGVGYSV